jgi:hypothetical protein
VAVRLPKACCRSHLNVMALTTGRRWSLPTLGEAFCSRSLASVSSLCYNSSRRADYACVDAS